MSSDHQSEETLTVVQTAGQLVPAAQPERDRLRRLTADYVRRHELLPPLGLADLSLHASRLRVEAGTAPEYRDFLALLLHNALWCDEVAAVPYGKRLLLLPKCLRAKGECKGVFDEIGLRCARCGRCCLDGLQEQAEKLGYAVLIAEGSPVVKTLLASGRIEAIIGVSCLPVLEQVFPFLEDGAIPSLAVPLLKDGCEATGVDLDWVRETILLDGAGSRPRLELHPLREEVATWFTPAALDVITGEARTRTQIIARDWLARSGKRWRPFLATGVARALQPGGATYQDKPAEAGTPNCSVLLSEQDQPVATVNLTHKPSGVGSEIISPGLQKLAVAVECFHKASLVHDDIEDDDPVRYDRPALHMEYGVPVALNTGDYLLGEGYRLIAACEAPAETIVRMLEVAAQGHRTLCLGQGAELCWMRQPHPFSVREVLDLFREKTAPAFTVALQLGALYSGAGDELLEVLARFSNALGIAYQIRDDLEDFRGGHDSDDLKSLRPSLLLSLAWENADAAMRLRLERFWTRHELDDWTFADLRAAVFEAGGEAAALRLLESYRNQALACVTALQNVPLRLLLRRVVGKILGG